MPQPTDDPSAIIRTQIVSSGVPRLFEIAIPLPGFGWFGRSIIRLTGAALDAANGILFWRHRNGFAKTDLRSTDRWLNVGRAWLRTNATNAADWREIEPSQQQPTLLASEGEESFGRMQFCLEPTLDAEGRGRVMFRVAWLPSKDAWDLVFAPTKDDLKSIELRGRPTVAITLDDVTLCSKRAKNVSSPKIWANSLKFGSCRITQVLECIESPFTKDSSVDVLAIDFGTHQTNLASWHFDSASLELHTHPLPWFYQSIGLSTTDGSDTTEPSVTVRGFRDKGYNYPRPIDTARPLLKAGEDPELRSFGFDSVSLQIPTQRVGHLLYSEVALGAECRKLLQQDQSLYVHLRPSPKLFLATTHNQVGQAAGSAADNDSRVVYSFLREVFNSFATSASMINDRSAILDSAPPRKREVRPILYSFPVSFTSNQMRDLKKSTLDALRDSTLYRSIQPGADGLIDVQAFADESTAAALGVFFHRFGTLDPRSIADAYRPFRPSETEAPTRIQPIDILCVDLGGGTSDVALIRLEECPKEGCLEVRTRESFGFPRAGLAVTQAIAQRLKQGVKAQLEEFRKEKGREDIFDKGMDALRTNFEKAALGRETRELTEQQQENYAQRRLRTQMWYDVAERFKRELCESANDHLTMTAQELDKLGLVNLGINPSEIKLTRQDLETETRRVFAPAIKRVREWLKQYPVDFVVLSGRSFRLPGIRDRFNQLLVEHNRLAAKDPDTLGRPIRCHNIVDLAWLKQNHGLLHHHFPHAIDFDKALVPLGLLEKYNLEIRPFRGDAIKVAEANEGRRTRHIGAVIDVWLQAAAHYESLGTLFIADHQPINSETDISKLVLAPGARRVFIAVNFLGAGRLRAEADEIEDCVDPPRQLGTIDIVHAPGISRLESITVRFRQITATSVEMVDVTANPRGADPIIAKPTRQDDGTLEVRTAFFTLTWKELVILDDFRTDGMIDILDIDKDGDGKA